MRKIEAFSRLLWGGGCSFFRVGGEFRNAADELGLSINAGGGTTGGLVAIPTSEVPSMGKRMCWVVYVRTSATGLLETKIAPMPPLSQVNSACVFDFSKGRFFRNDGEDHFTGLPAASTDGTRAAFRSEAPPVTKESVMKWFSGVWGVFRGLIACILSNVREPAVSLGANS